MRQINVLFGQSPKEFLSLNRTHAKQFLLKWTENSFSTLLSSSVSISLFSPFLNIQSADYAFSTNRDNNDTAFPFAIYSRHRHVVDRQVIILALSRLLSQTDIIGEKLRKGDRWRGNGWWWLCSRSIRRRGTGQLGRQARTNKVIREDRRSSDLLSS